MKAQLIFNPAAGNPAEAGTQLVEVLRQLQAQDIQAEVLLVEPEYRLDQVAAGAVRAGAKMVIASGGDGTIEAVALGLVGSRTPLGIIPTGTRNNLARSLGIPTDNMADAIALLRQGRQIKIDVGQVHYRKKSHCFLEASVIGLASALYPSADNIQRGDLGKIPEFISTLVSAEPSEIRLRVGRWHKEIVTQAYLVIVANMPFMGANFHIAPDIVFDDRRLDVFVYSDLSKRELISQAVQLASAVPDERIQRFCAKTIKIMTSPAMPVMADGISVGNGSVTVTLHPRQLRVMAGPANGKEKASIPAAVARDGANSGANDHAGVPHGE